MEIAPEGVVQFEAGMETVVHFEAGHGCAAVCTPAPAGPPREEDRPNRSLRALTIRVVPASTLRFSGCSAPLRLWVTRWCPDAPVVSVPAVGLAVAQVFCR